MPAFDAAPMVGIVRDAAAGVPGVETWLGGLDPRGRIEGAKLRYDFDDRALDYEANVSAIALENWKGVPYVRNASAKVAGTERSVEIVLNGDQVGLGFLDFYEHPTEFQHLEGSVLIWFVPGYLAVQGHDLAGTFGDSTIHGQFTFGRPSDELEQRLLMALRINDIDGRDGLGIRAARVAAVAARRSRSGDRRRDRWIRSISSTTVTCARSKDCRCVRRNCALRCTTAPCDSIPTGRRRPALQGRSSTPRSARSGDSTRVISSAST